MKQKLYFFTNAFPYGIGEEWKINELAILSKHFRQIEIIPYQFDGNQTPKKIDINNIVARTPLFRDNSILVNRAALLRILFSKHFFYFLREFCKKKVYRNKEIMKAFFSDAVKTNSLAEHPQIVRLLKEQD